MNRCQYPSLRPGMRAKVKFVSDYGRDIKKRIIKKNIFIVVKADLIEKTLVKGRNWCLNCVNTII